jgi:hypothetical protein
VLIIEKIDAVRPLAVLQRQTQGNERLTMVQTDFGYPAIERLRILTGGQQVEYLGIDTAKPALNLPSTFHHVARQHVLLRARHDGLQRIRPCFTPRKARDSWIIARMVAMQLESQ